MGNSLTIISRKQKEKLYKNLEGKWLIELEGRKMNDWDDFYYQIMSQIDFYEYSKKFEISSHTVKDAALEFEVIEKYLQDNNYNGIAIVYKYPNFKMDNLERGYIYVTIISNFIDSLYHLDYEEVNLIIDELVEKLLLERGNKGKIYGIID